MPTSSRGMKAQLTTNVPGGLGTFARPSLIKAVYKSHATQNLAFYQILGNNQQSKRISNYPAYYQNYLFLKNKYGKFSQTTLGA